MLITTEKRKMFGRSVRIPLQVASEGSTGKGGDEA